MTKRSFRDSASFGKRMEYSVIAQMLEDGLDVFVPLVDDKGIDAIVRLGDGQYVDIQIKARSKTVNKDDEGLFAGVRYYNRDNYFYVFMAEGLGRQVWVMSAQEFYKLSYTEKKGIETPTRCIKFNGSGSKHLVLNPKFDEFRVNRVADRFRNKKLRTMDKSI